jgi:hypothetical protein
LVGGMSGGGCVGTCFRDGFGRAVHRHPFKNQE